MKKLIYLSVILLLTNSLLFSQIAINSDGSPPDPSAALDIDFTNKGFLLPRMTNLQRDAIPNPAEGLMVYCLDCGDYSTGVLSIFQGGAWRNFNFICVAPDMPETGTHTSELYQITWEWEPVSLANGYKWDTVNYFPSAKVLGNVTSFTETGLPCNSSFTRYVWAYNECGQSPVLVLNASTVTVPFSPAPTPFIPIAQANAITWTWFNVTGETGFKWNTENDPTTAVNLGPDVLTYLETGLNCQANYTRYVWAVGECGISPVSQMSGTTLSVQPSATVAGTHVPAINQIVWNWQPVTGATYYRWNTTNDLGGASNLGNVTTHTETGLTCSTPYVRYLWVITDCGTSQPVSLTSTTLTDPPDAPLAGTHQATSTQITWNWSPVVDAAYYKWSLTNDSLTATSIGNVTSKIESGLTCNNPYTRYLWACNNCGTSPVTILDRSTTPDPPTPPLAGTHEATPVQITWRWETVPGAIAYYWGITNEFNNATPTGTDLFKLQTGLTCNTLCESYVWAESSCGISSPTQLLKSTATVPPDAPTAGTHEVTATQITWQWNTVPDAIAYFWNTENNLATATPKQLGTLHLETGLTCNSPYTRYVWAQTACGTSSAGTLTQSTSTISPNTPVAGTHVATVTQITWNWSAVTNATGYKWSISNDSVTAQPIGNVTTYIQSGLPCNNPQTCYVWAYYSCGISLPATLAFSTLADPPDIPVAGTHEATNAQITWHWNLVTDATGYFWNTEDNLTTADPIGNVASLLETDLSCNSSYTRYLWATSACGTSASVQLTRSTTNDPPSAPVAGTHSAGASSITWNWNAVPSADEYFLNDENNLGTAQNIGNVTSYPETGLVCNTSYTKYLWASSDCGTSSAITLTCSTLTDPPSAPTAGTHVATTTQITWNWNTVPNADGYRWNTINDFNTATPMGTATSFIETGLGCGQNHTSFAWAYNECGTSTALTMTKSTTNCWACGTPLTITHLPAGGIAPVEKTTTYGTVTGVPGEPTKCWITSNLGSDRQATSFTDDTEASAGWYWQFNRKQGYKHDGTDRTPNTAWVTGITETFDWTSAADPCQSLGTGWRIATYTEWNNVRNSGNWNNGGIAYNSALKLHAAGYLHNSSGSLESRGGDVPKGCYWSSTTYPVYSGTQGYILQLLDGGVNPAFKDKASGLSIRCIK